MLNLKQSDCRYGAVAFAAGEDLSLKTGYLAKLNAGGDLVLPQGAGEITPYVLTQGADQGYLCGAMPLTSAGNCRVKLTGTCEAGDLLVAKGDGRVEAGVSGGEALPIGTAEENGVDGQHVLLRPVSVGAVGPAGADGADGEDGADGSGSDGGTIPVPFGSINGTKPADAGAAIGLVIYLDGNGVWQTDAETYGVSGHLYTEGVVVGCESDGTTVRVLLLGMVVDGDTYEAVAAGPDPKAIPLACFGNAASAVVGRTCGQNGAYCGTAAGLVINDGDMYDENVGVKLKILYVGSDYVLCLNDGAAY